jgi:hypothetical protein
MKKTIFLILLFSVTINLLSAQKERKRVLIINSGVSVPFSEFAVKKMVIDAGFAGTGFNVGIDYLSSKIGWLGFTASAGYSILNFDNKAYRSEYERILDQNGEVTITAGNYNIFKTVAGLYLKIPEFYHLELLFIAQLGYSLSIHPEINVDHSQYGKINSIKQDHDWALVSNLSMKVNYNLSDKYGVNLTYCLNYLRPGFEDDSYFINMFFMPVRFQNINLGFIIKL